VIDLRYENPIYMAEEAAAADLISGGRLQLGVGRGSPEPALRGAEAFGYNTNGEGDTEIARRKIARFVRRSPGQELSNQILRFPGATRDIGDAANRAPLARA
jgi:alkanesulfonate monooxygenase SsuD/methylene tetrahydromethanopterin reductase-like flavin-dependent oxidoreductase (luciferase family)